MGEEAARQAVYTIAAVGALVWLWALRSVAAAAREARPDDDGPSLVGSEILDGTPAGLAGRAATRLGSSGPDRLGPVRVRERTDRLVRFEGPDDPASERPPIIGRGELRFVPVSDSMTEVLYRLEPNLTRRPLRIASALLALGLIALIGGVAAARIYAVPSSDPVFRGQSLQIVQVVHLLWPPFFFASLYRERVRAVRSAIESLIWDLPARGWTPCSTGVETST